MSKHTSGPWFASPLLTNEYGEDVVTVGPFDVSDKPAPEHFEDTICQVFGGNYPAVSNARLIAAAPELLEALKAAAVVMSRNIYPKPDAGPDHPWATLQRVRATITKAEGVVRAEQTSVQELAAEYTLIRFQLEQAEAEIERLRAASAGERERLRELIAEWRADVAADRREGNAGGYFHGGNDMKETCANELEALLAVPAAATGGAK
jgi:hypothetical protein